MSLLTTPREVQLIIFGQLSVPELLRVSRTCHQLKEAARDPALWKKLTLTYERVKNKNEACRNHVSRCSSLREIFITGEEKAIISDKIMAVVMKAKDTLTSITLSPSFAGLSNSSFVRIGNMTQLTHLAVGGGKLGPKGVAALACLTELRSFKVPGIFCGNFSGNSESLPVSSSMAVLVDLFSTLKKLEEVEIKMESNYPSDLVVKSLVNNNPNLHHLDISTSAYPFRRNPNDELSSRSLILLADKCPQLTHIGIGNLTMFSSTSITKLVTNCPNLIHANFEGTMVDNTALAVMSKKCTELEHLNISNCERITQEGLEGFVYPAYAAKLKLKFLDIKRDYYRFPMITSRNFLNRLKHDLPNLKIDADEEMQDDDSSDSSDSSDSDESDDHEEMQDDDSYYSDENYSEYYNSYFNNYASDDDEEEDDERARGEDCCLM